VWGKRGRVRSSVVRSSCSRRLALSTSNLHTGCANPRSPPNLHSSRTGRGNLAKAGVAARLGSVVVVTALLIVVGIAGTLLPILPGVALIWAATIAYGLVEGFGAVGLTAMAIITGLAFSGDLACGPGPPEGCGGRSYRLAGATPRPRPGDRGLLRHPGTRRPSRVCRRGVPCRDPAGPCPSLEHHPFDHQGPLRGGGYPVRRRLRDGPGVGRMGTRDLGAGRSSRGLISQRSTGADSDRSPVGGARSGEPTVQRVPGQAPPARGSSQS
jgi:hypothetical protein